MAPISSPRTQTQGFFPLKNDKSDLFANDDAGIPLNTVRTNTNTTTGTRQADQVLFENVSMSSSTEDEKDQSHAHQHRGRRKGRHATRSNSEDFSVNTMGRIYNKIIGFSAIMRYLVYVVPVALLLAVPLVVLPLTGDRHRITIGDLPGHPAPSLFDLFLWIEIAWFALWVAKSIAHLFPQIFMFFCGVVSSGTRKYATVLHNLEIPISLFLWALANWLIFRAKFTDDTIIWVGTTKKILLGLFLSSAVFLGEKAIVQLISITYHQRSFANRIKDSKREVHLLGLMYDASRTLFPTYCPEFVEEDYIISDTLDLLRKPANRGGGVGAAPVRFLGNVGRFGDKLTSAVGNLASEITGKNVLNGNSAHSIIVEALEKTRSTEALARRIWLSFVVEGYVTLSTDDIVEVLGPDHKEEAEECFAAIDADGNGDITLDEMVYKVAEIGKERKAITEGMKDIGQALSVFDQVLLFVVALIVVFIFLAVFQSSFLSTLATAGTALLSLSFVFATTTQEFLGSCIFLFVKHPYDVGDRVDIVGSERMNLVVDKISLLYTCFTRIDKNQVVQVPNINLNSLWIENVTRSKSMRETLELNVSYDTTPEDVELLRREMEAFVRMPEHCRDYQPDVAISVAGLGDLDKLTLRVGMLTKTNWHNDALRASRRSKFIAALHAALKKIPIYSPGGGGNALGSPENPTYSVAISDDAAAQNRDRATKDKDAKRMVSSPSAAAAASSLPVPTNTAVTRSTSVSSAAHLSPKSPISHDEWSASDPLSRSVSHVDPSMGRHRSGGRRKPGETLPPPHIVGPDGGEGSSTPSAVRDNILRSMSQASRMRTREYDPESGLVDVEAARMGLYPAGGDENKNLAPHQAGARSRGQSMSRPGLNKPGARQS